MNIILIYFSIKYKGDWDKIYDALDAREEVDMKQIREIEQKIKDEKWNITTILDSDYPIKLKDAFKPPFVLWYEGNKDLLKNELICLTGNAVTENLSNKIEKFTGDALKRYTLITPSFKGVDQEVAKVSKAEPKIMVLANGLKNPYMNSEKNPHDLIMTEYPHEVHVSKQRLRARNRILSSMAKSLVLFSSRKHGGMENMVNNFLECGKDIYCFPGDLSEEDGNTEFINQGATMIGTISDIN